MRPVKMFDYYYREEHRHSRDLRIKFSRKGNTTYTIYNAYPNDFKFEYWNMTRDAIPHIYIGKMPTMASEIHQLYWNIPDSYAVSFFLTPYKKSTLAEHHDAEYELLSAMQINDQPSLLHLLLALNRQADNANIDLGKALRNWCREMKKQFPDSTDELYSSIYQLFGNSKKVVDGTQAIEELKNQLNTATDIKKICINLILAFCALNQIGCKRDCAAAHQYLHDVQMLADKYEVEFDLLISDVITSTLQSYIDNPAVPEHETATTRTYLASLFMLRGKDADAFTYLENAFRLGDPKAALLLGEMYIDGRSDSTKKANYDDALQTYTTALDKTDSFALANELLSAARKVYYLDAANKLYDKFMTDFIDKALLKQTPTVIVSQLKLDAYNLLTSQDIYSAIETYLKSSAVNNVIFYPDLMLFHNIVNAPKRVFIETYSAWIDKLITLNQPFDFRQRIEYLQVLSKDCFVDKDRTDINELIAKVLQVQKLFLPTVLNDEYISTINLLIELKAKNYDKNKSSLSIACNALLHALQNSLAKIALEINLLPKDDIDRSAKVEKFVQTMQLLLSPRAAVFDTALQEFQTSSLAYVTERLKLQEFYKQYLKENPRAPQKGTGFFHELKQKIKDKKTLSLLEETYYLRYKLKQSDGTWVFSGYRNRNAAIFLQKLRDLATNVENPEARFVLVEYYLSHPGQYLNELDTLSKQQQIEGQNSALLEAASLRWLGLYHQKAIDICKRLPLLKITHAVISNDYAHLRSALSTEIIPITLETPPANVAEVIKRILDGYSTKLHPHTITALQNYYKKMDAITTLQTEIRFFRARVDYLELNANRVRTINNIPAQTSNSTPVEGSSPKKYNK